MHRTPPSRRKAQILIWLFLFFLPSAGWAQSGFQLSVSVVPNTTCAKGTDGEIHMTLQNGLPPYQVIWEGPNGPLSASGSASSNNLSATNLISGDYFLTVTDRGGGVIKDNFFVADESDPCGQIDETISHPSSATSQDGALSLVIPFGTGSYIFSPGGQSREHRGFSFCNCSHATESRLYESGTQCIQFIGHRSKRVSGGGWYLRTYWRPTGIGIDNGYDRNPSLSIPLE